MGTCCKCKEEFPDEILTSMFISSEGNTEPLCGVCALEITNRIHHAKRKRFKGEIAQYYLEQAKKIKKRRKNAKAKT